MKKKRRKLKAVSLNQTEMFSFWVEYAQYISQLLIFWFSKMDYDSSSIIFSDNGGTIAFHQSIMSHLGPPIV